MKFYYWFVVSSFRSGSGRHVLKRVALLLHAGQTKHLGEEFLSLEAESILGMATARDVERLGLAKAYYIAFPLKFETSKF